MKKLCLSSCIILASVVMLMAATYGVQAQSRFSPVVQVGESVVTGYQLDQRTKFLSLLGAPGDPRALAREQLINEAVQVSAAKSAGIAYSPEEVDGGMEEFASRANLTREQFVTALGQNGVDAETFRDFISAGVAWRTYVRSRFSDSAREGIPKTLIRRTLASSGTEGGLRVLVSEILLPATTPETAAASRARAAKISSLVGEQAFAAAARELSVAASSSRGGELNWVALEGLPEEVRGVISSLSPGQISRPIELENAIGIFLLRDLERVAPGAATELSLDYALFITEGDRAAAEAVAAKVDGCDDLYAVTKGLPPERLVRETVTTADLPDDIRAEVAKLDQDETSTAIVRSGNATVLMLCDRKPALESTVDLEIVGNRLLNTRLGTMAADHLADLRAGTTVYDIAR